MLKHDDRCVPRDATKSSREICSWLTCLTGAPIVGNTGQENSGHDLDGTVFEKLELSLTKILPRCFRAPSAIVFMVSENGKDPVGRTNLLQFGQQPPHRTDIAIYQVTGDGHDIGLSFFNQGHDLIYPTATCHGSKVEIRNLEDSSPIGGRGQLMQWQIHHHNSRTDQSADPPNRCPDQGQSHREAP